MDDFNVSTVYVAHMEGDTCHDDMAALEAAICHSILAFSGQHVDQ
jgi:hypothetical protein